MQNIFVLCVLTKLLPKLCSYSLSRELSTGKRKKNYTIISHFPSASGDFVSQTPFWSYTPGPHWGTSVPRPPEILGMAVLTDLLMAAPPPKISKRQNEPVQVLCIWQRDRTCVGRLRDRTSHHDTTSDVCCRHDAATQGTSSHRVFLRSLLWWHQQQNHTRLRQVRRSRNGARNQNNFKLIPCSLVIVTLAA